jgi:outer membrane protein assembly factor BamA
LPYYGIGEATPIGDKEIYTPRGIDLQVTAQQRLRQSLYGVLGARVLDQRLRFDSAGALAAGTTVGTAGGRTVELTGGALLDTRDHLFAPERGTFSQLTFTMSDRALGSQYTYQRLRLDARRYMRLAPSHVLAAHVVTIGTSGQVPFDQLPLSGGSDILRGYARGRYRDRYLAAAQLEYRSPFVRRVGAVAFAGAGTVGERLGALASSAVLPTYGVGLRVQIDPRQRTAVRADYGRGRDGASGLYIGFNQSF